MNNTNSITIKFDLRIVCVALLLIIIGMLALWRPWTHTTASSERKITITGESTVKGVPDEFVFYPSFDRTGTDLASMKNDLNTFGTKLVTDMKGLGVSDQDVTLDSSSYDSYDSSDSTDTSQTITLQATITAHTKAMAQKVQDYLAKTDAKGELTAQPQFSDSKEKSLENSARLQAIADARQKADQTASNVGAKLGKVISVSDDTSSGGGCRTICPLVAGANLDSSAKSGASLPVTAGTSDVTGSVEVVFALD